MRDASIEDFYSYDVSVTLNEEFDVARALAMYSERFGELLCDGDGDILFESAPRDDVLEAVYDMGLFEKSNDSPEGQYVVDAFFNIDLSLKATRRLLLN